MAIVFFFFFLVFARARAWLQASTKALKVKMWKSQSHVETKSEGRLLKRSRRRYAEHENATMSKRVKSRAAKRGAN